MSKSALPCGAPATICVARAVMTASSKAFLVASTASSQPWTCAGAWAEAGTGRARAQARNTEMRERGFMAGITREARCAFPERLECEGVGYSGIVVWAGFVPAGGRPQGPPLRHRDPAREASDSPETRGEKA